jgi:tetratricopeptide (TPR) repeat protein
MATTSTAGGGLPRTRLYAIIAAAVVVALIVVGLAVLATGGTDGTGTKAAAKPTTAKPLPGRPSIAVPPLADAPDGAAARVAWAKRLVATQPSTEATVRLAAAQADAGDEAAARATLAGDTSPGAQAAMALLDYDAKQPATAVAALKALAAEAPQDAFVGFSYGEALLWSGQRAAGEAVLRTVRDTHPDTFYGVASDDLMYPTLPAGYPPFVPSQAVPTRTLAQLKQAADTRFEQLQPQLDYGAALLAAGQRKAAGAAFSDALAVDPDSVEAKVGKIIASYNKDKPAASFGQMGPLARDNPSNVSPRLHLAMMLLWLRDTDAARAQLRQVAAKDPNGRLGQFAQQVLDSL